MADLFPSGCAGPGIKGYLPDIFPVHRSMAAMFIVGRSDRRGIEKFPGRGSAGGEMTQETHNMFQCRRKVAFARLLRAAVVLAALAAVSPLFAEGGFGEAPML